MLFAMHHLSVVACFRQRASEAMQRLLFRGSGLLIELLLPRVDEVECFAWGDFIDISSANFIEERMLFVPKQCHLPLAGLPGSVAVRRRGSDFWGLGNDNSGAGFT